MERSGFCPGHSSGGRKWMMPCFITGYQNLAVMRPFVSGGVGLVRVGDAVVHQAEAQLRQRIIGTFAAAKYAWLYIALTFPRTEKNIPASALFNHPLGDVNI